MKGWYSRGYLPHFDQACVLQGVTFRLHDSLPQEAVDQMASAAGLELDSSKRARIEELMNAGYGACYLRIPALALLVENALLHFDGDGYRLLAWVIMPNHVYVLIEQVEGHPLGKVGQSWKSSTAHQANKLLSRSGLFWARDYFDRYIRNQEHL